MDLHARQANAYGWLGAAGFAISFVGGFTVVVPSVCECADVTMPSPYSLGGGSGRGVAVLAWEAGLLLLGIATLSARALPLPRQALPLATFLVFPFSIILTPLMLGAGLGSGFFHPRACRGR